MSVYATQQAALEYIMLSRKFSISVFWKFNRICIGKKSSQTV